MPKCDCPVCQDKDLNLVGIQLAEKEIIPFFKKELFKLKYPEHPFPFKYRNILASILCYSQALSFSQAHNQAGRYYTDNKWLLKHALELKDKFGCLDIVHRDQLKGTHKLVCEFNIES